MSDDATLDDFTTEAGFNNGGTTLRLGSKQVKIPDSWNVSTFEEINNLDSPIGYGVVKPGDDIEDGTPLVKIEDVVDGYLTPEQDFHQITEEKDEKYSRSRLSGGEILVSIQGTVGNVVIAPPEMAGANISRTIARVTPSQPNNHWIKYYIQSKPVQDYIQVVSSGSTRASYNIGDIRKTSVALPPLSEQRKIATVLHTVDQAIQKTGEVIERYNIIKSEISEELVFRGISSEEHKTVRIGPKKAKVASDWSVSTFGDICDVQQGLQIAKSNRFRKDGEHRYQYITVQYLNDPQDPANNWYIESPRDTVVCSTEDVLMTRTGNTGEVVTGVEGVFHNNFFKIEFDSDVLLRDYLVHYLESKAIQDVLISYAGTTTIPDLNHGEFFNIPVLLPPIDQQASISKKVGQLSKAITIEKEYLNYLHSLKQGVMQDLLSGEVRTTDADIDIPEEVAKYG